MQHVRWPVGLVRPIAYFTTPGRRGLLMRGWSWYKTMRSPYVGFYDPLETVSAR